MIEILDPGTDERRLNLAKLEKGDWLPLEVLRDASGFDPGENLPKYIWYLLNLRNKLRKKHNLLSKSIDYGLLILQDNEASEYKAKQSKIRRRGCYRDYEDLGRIDEAKLTPGELKEHRQRVREASLYLAATQRVRQVIRTEKRAAVVNQQMETLKRSQKPVIVLSTKGSRANGVSGSQGDLNRGSAPGAPQRMDGQPDASASAADEIIHGEKAKD